VKRILANLAYQVRHAGGGTVAKAKTNPKRVKALAKKQKISVRLTQKQIDSLQKLWSNADPGKPAEITFKIKGSERARFKIAAYSYADSTCCAKIE